MRHGSLTDPPNRFETVHCEITGEDFEGSPWGEEYLDAIRRRRIEYLDDQSKTIVTENKSPDIPFRYSVNPYRGCVHGCAYCYARNSHEYLGLNAGLDFETKIIVKRNAPELFKAFLMRKRWQCQWIAFSGVTDCYQPAERQFRLTRQCLEVASQFSQPVGIVTKNALVTRDLDLLKPLAKKRLVHVYLSVTTLSQCLAGSMEPRTSTPTARLRAIRLLSEAGVPTGVMVAPIIPGLNDSEIPAILQAAKEAGAQTAGSVLLRLPLTVEPVFREWLHRTYPSKAAVVESRIQQTRDGTFNQSEWHQRMQGTGVIWQQIQALMQTFSRKYGLDQPLPPLDCTQFCCPTVRLPRQLPLFD